ncbi:hypothetical protein [Puniceicoccus vermicola]|uniref:DUF3137 domain-containing protein n=1 Tax=Puniceicoccus vermicola TaxID=388746 RepID=A0A7X1AYA1_9BACT|nr:hypothetical protein [Puniceicoccus vermicola]MBC2602129.1 hypothetical protein [Puniceicoccus vermicola]
MNPVFIIIPVVIVFGGLAYYGWLQQKKRREALAALARKHGLQFFPEKNKTEIRQFEFIDPIRKGSNRYLYNRLRGDMDGRTLETFDFHYETHSTDSKGNRTTHHYHGSSFLLMLPGAFPELRIYREGIFQKFAQMLGFDDIDFESVEFSKRYNVKSRDKKFAYDFCNARMIDYLLDEEDLNIEVEGAWLVLAFSRKTKVEDWERNVARLGSIFGLMPEYLFEEERPIS